MSDIYDMASDNEERDQDLEKHERMPMAEAHPIPALPTSKKKPPE